MPHSEAQAWWADVQHVRESIERRRAGGAESSTPLDAALVDDNRVKHGVTAVQPLDASRPAWRDVLVVTFRARR